MSYNGSGTFNINSTGQPVVAGTVITASAFNALTTDLATGLTTAITKDGQTTTTARITFAQGITSSLVTDSSSVSTGSIITAGGAGIAKNLYVGGIASFSAQPIFTSLTASSAVATDASKGLVSVTNTGTGNNVLATSPTLVTPILGTPQSGTLTSCTGLPNAGLVNSSITIGGTAIALGASSSAITNDITINGLTVGKGAGTGVERTVVGNASLGFNTTGANPTAVGSQAMYSNTTGSNNSAFGRASLLLNTTGSSNTAIGQDTLYNNTTFSFNTAVGYQALYANAVSGNTATGYQSMLATTTGTSNAAFGLWTLKANTTGQFNTAIGDQALLANTTASSNTAVGYTAGSGVAGTGNGNNIFLGYSSGSNLTTGSYNAYIGTSAQPSSVSVIGEIVINASGGSTGKGGNTGFINPNGGGVYQGNNAATWSVTSDQRLKKNIVDNTEGLSIISQIRVRNFEYRTAEEVTELPAHSVIEKQGVQLGVIAQELQQILPECVKTESTGVMTVDADNLTWYLINAVKELSARVKQLEGN